MSYISEKVAYLDGLADGLGVEKDDKYGKLLRGIIDALGAIAEEMEEQNEALDDLSDCVDDLYDEVDQLDECLFDEEDEEYDDFDEEDTFLEVVCPSCGETFYFDEEMLDSEDGLICPSCNEPVEIALCDGDCDCCEEDD
ncbi:MAG: hypothetical protein IJC66_05820 [Kiritimatiellae bacterium]|nr:hypothetical protein [Kiritimatiellia bacterium]